MTLSKLISKRGNATATVATLATVEGKNGGSVASVASVAVANRQSDELQQKALACLEQNREAKYGIVTNDPVVLVSCGNCRNFEPDHINPAQGLGRCKIGADNMAGAPLPWPKALRECAEFAPGGKINGD